MTEFSTNEEITRNKGHHIFPLELKAMAQNHATSRGEGNGSRNIPSTPLFNNGGVFSKQNGEREARKQKGTGGTLY